MISFAPLLGLHWLLLLGVGCAVAIIIAIAVQARGAVWRLLGFAFFLLILSGPAWLQQSRRNLPDIAMVVVDQSQSMNIGDRAGLAARALLKLQADATKIANLRLRVVDVPATPDGGTSLFAAVRDALDDVPAAQLAAVIAITDGEIADAPKADPFKAPFSALLTARGNETDRELHLINAPSYGLVGGNVALSFAVIDHGGDAGVLAPVSISENGTVIRAQNVTVGAQNSIEVPVRHAGPAIISVQAAPLAGEVSSINDQASFTLNGVRKRLEVLLVSGNPSQGERSWRVLLKSDPAVQLVHFTILRRPGEIMDALPDELALVPFPVQQLFDADIGKFDLIILDQFDATGLLPPEYLANIAAYVQNGGALLVEVGPEFAEDGSLAFTPLAPVLPAVPATPGTITQRFTPEITVIGQRHPVTAPFAEMRLAPWYRQEIVTPTGGDVLMTGIGNAPLLILAKAGQGRVGMLLSDQFWLWTRGPAEVGPALPLLRRSVHWLLDEPALEAEALSAAIGNGRIEVQRQTLGSFYPGDATVTGPNGSSVRLKLRQTAPGVYAAGLPAGLPGVWQIKEGGLTADAAQAAENALEFEDLAATGSILAPVSRNIVWLGRDTPSLAALLQPRHASVVTGSREIPLLPPLPCMLLALALLGAAWWRERG